MAHFSPCAGSFRDPSGRVYSDGTVIHRTIQKCYASQWEAVRRTGFLESAVARGVLVPFKEVASSPLGADAWKVIESPLLPFISYPYEWSFGQLKDAALHTLDVQDEALKHGLVLRDATAYNIQFQGVCPLFIDLLSFDTWDKSKPWQAYLQFCKHFLAPLALMAKCSTLCGKILASWIDGIPLDLAATLLPWSTRFTPSLAIHIHLHARMQAKYSDPRAAAQKISSINLSEKTIPNLIASLRQSIESLHLPQSLSTEWGDYYTDTNYSETAANDKMQYLRNVATSLSSNHVLAVDLGANRAVYSEFLAETFTYVIALDIDYLAVEHSYQGLKKKNSKNVLPLVVDLCNPSPGIGWNNEERLTLNKRCQADYLSALALVHHLAFTGGIPLDRIAAAFADLTAPCGLHVLEFVPHEDSQVQRLLAARNDVTVEYSMDACLKAFGVYFDLVERHNITDSKRTLLVWRKK